MKLWFDKGIWTRKNIEKKIKDLSFSDIKKIAILRHAALGDMVLTRSFIIEARKAFPNAVITLSIVSNYIRRIPEDQIDLCTYYQWIRSKTSSIEMYTLTFMIYFSPICNSAIILK